VGQVQLKFGGKMERQSRCTGQFQYAQPPGKIFRQQGVIGKRAELKTHVGKNVVAVPVFECVPIPKKARAVGDQCHLAQD
jgi:hypothetical protein